MADDRAFPSGAIDDRFGGMTLREWYAGQALVGLLSHASDEAPSRAVTVAWIIADEMMAERDLRRAEQGGQDNG